MDKNKNRKRTLEWIQNISNINKGRKNNLNKGMVYNCFHKEYGSFTGTLPQLIRSFPDLKLKIQCLRDVSNNKTVRNNHKGWAVSKTS